MKRKNIIITIILVVILLIGAIWGYIRCDNNRTLSSFSTYVQAYKRDIEKCILTGNEKQYHLLIEQSEKVITDKNYKTINEVKSNLEKFKEKVIHENLELINKSISEIEGIDITILGDKDFVTVKTGDIKKLIEEKEFIKANEVYILLKDDINKKIEIKKQEGERKKAEEERKRAEEEANKIRDLLNKEKYMKKLNNIEIGLQDLSEKYAGSMCDMRSAANEEYKRWDAALNEIYQVLRVGLKPDVMNTLKNEQLNWINYRDNTAKEDSLDFQGGSMEDLQYSSSLGRLTKDRCYKLVKQYMN